jgi:hypothetical protein
MRDIIYIKYIHPYIDQIRIIIVHNQIERGSMKSIMNKSCDWQGKSDWLCWV